MCGRGDRLASRSTLPNPLLRGILSAKPRFRGSFWDDSSLVKPDATVLDFFPFDPNSSEISFRLQAYVLASNFPSDIALTSKPSSSADRISARLTVFGVDQEVPLSVAITPQDKSSIFDDILRSLASATSRHPKIRRTFDGTDQFVAYLRSIWIDPNCIINGLKVRGMLVVPNSTDAANDTGIRYIRVDERPVAEMCENPSLLASLSTNQAIDVPFSATATIGCVSRTFDLHLTLVPDSGFVPGQK
jgi:hypothetical protein